MKNTYKNGVFVCYQVARSEGQAIDFAKMYGHKGAAFATLVEQAQ